MFEFEYHFKDKTLYLHPPGSPRQPITKTFTTNWGAPGFILEPANHWITFATYPNKIKVFYKQVIIPSQESLWSLEQINYYCKELPKEEIITFIFTKADQVHKINNQWTKKHD